MRGSARPPLPDIDLVRLPRLSARELHGLWRSCFGTGKPPPKRRLLVRELAYHVQSQRLGGLDADTRKRLNMAVRAAARAAGKRGGSGGSAGHPASDGATGPDGSTTPTPRRSLKHPVARPAAALLPTAATLVRVWNGRRHEVVVVEGGRAFVYRGATYRSLTAVARAITGTEWSGPRFFGLAAHPGKGAS